MIRTSSHDNRQVHPLFAELSGAAPANVPATVPHDSVHEGRVEALDHQDPRCRTAAGLHHDTRMPSGGRATVTAGQIVQNTGRAAIVTVPTS